MAGPVCGMVAKTAPWKIDQPSPKFAERVVMTLWRNLSTALEAMLIWEEISRLVNPCKRHVRQAKPDAF